MTSLLYYDIDTVMPKDATRGTLTVTHEGVTHVFENVTVSEAQDKMDTFPAETHGRFERNKHAATPPR